MGKLCPQFPIKGNRLLTRVLRSRKVKIVEFHRYILNREILKLFKFFLASFTCPICQFSGYRDMASLDSHIRWCHTFDALKGDYFFHSLKFFSQYFNAGI